MLAGSGHMRRGGSYFETCTPASFPVDRGDLPPAGSGCGYPYPAPIAKMNCKLHLYGSDVYTLDSTALVGRRGLLRAGRVPGPRAVPGAAREQPGAGALRDLAGRQRQGHRAGPGPTWTVGGQFCTGQASGCENHPTNQYALLVYKTRHVPGLRQTGACCTVEVER